MRCDLNKMKGHFEINFCKISFLHMNITSTEVVQFSSTNRMCCKNKRSRQLSLLPKNQVKKYPSKNFDKFKIYFYPHSPIYFNENARHSISSSTLYLLPSPLIPKLSFLLYRSGHYCRKIPVGKSAREINALLMNRKIIVALVERITWRYFTVRNSILAELPPPREKRRLTRSATLSYSRKIETRSVRVRAASARVSDHRSPRAERGKGK